MVSLRKSRFLVLKDELEELNVGACFSNLRTGQEQHSIVGNVIKDLGVVIFLFCNSRAVASREEVF